MNRKRNNREPVRVENIHGHAIGFYESTIEGQRVLIPSHIRRTEHKPTRLYGWQFVMVRQGVYAPSFFVPDKTRGPVQSLDIATAKLRIHLKSIDPRLNIPYKLKEIKTGLSKTGVAGVRLAWRFNRARSLYELSLESRAGVYTNSRSLRIYVGTEFTANEASLKEAFRKTRDFRQFQIERTLIGGKYKLPISRPGRRKMGVTVEQAQRLLEKKKESSEKYLQDFVQQRWPSLADLSSLTQWRRSRFTWRDETVFGTTLPVPSFVEQIGQDWEVTLSLPNGHVFGDRQTIGYDPEESLKELIWDSLTLHLMAAPNLNPTDTVHGEPWRLAEVASDRRQSA